MNEKMHVQGEMTKDEWLRAVVVVFFSGGYVLFILFLWPDDFTCYIKSPENPESTPTARRN